MSKCIYHPDFVTNKYHFWYFNIISNAKKHSRKKYKGIYYENHHILPKCIGGIDSDENLVLLTAKEHFTCHHLLTKFTKGKPKYQMYNAFHFMSIENPKQTRLKITSRQYETVRKLNSEFMSFIHSGRTFSENYKQKIRTGLSIGTFVTPWGEFVSATQAGASCPTGKLNPHVILRIIKNLDKKIPIERIIHNSFFNIEDKGKTHRELGFGFIPRTPD